MKLFFGLFLLCLASTGLSSLLPEPRPINDTVYISLRVITAHSLALASSNTDLNKRLSDSLGAFSSVNSIFSLILTKIGQLQNSAIFTQNFEQASYILTETNEFFYANNDAKDEIDRAIKSYYLLDFGDANFQADALVLNNILLKNSADLLENTARIDQNFALINVHLDNLLKFVNDVYDSQIQVVFEYQLNDAFDDFRKMLNKIRGYLSAASINVLAIKTSANGITSETKRIVNSLANLSNVTNSITTSTTYRPTTYTYTYFTYPTYTYTTSITTTTSLNWNGQNWAMNCDFFGNDIADVQSTGAECSGICQRNSACTHFAWTANNGGRCWLKNKIPVSQSDAQYSSIPNSVCGLATGRSINWNGQNWAMNCDFPGNDIANVQSIGAECSSICQANRACTHFAWSSNNGGTVGNCWLKNKPGVSKSDAKSYLYSNSVCGLATARSINKRLLVIS